MGYVRNEGNQKHGQCGKCLIRGDRDGERVVDDRLDAVVVKGEDLESRELPVPIALEIAVGSRRLASLKSKFEFSLAGCTSKNSSDTSVMCARPESR